jgi:hypothetical protein
VGIWLLGVFKLIGSHIAVCSPHPQAVANGEHCEDLSIRRIRMTCKGNRKQRLHGGKWLAKQKHSEEAQQPSTHILGCNDSSRKQAFLDRIYHAGRTRPTSSS